MTPFATCAGPELQNIFSGADDRFIVFHNQDRISGGAQIAEKIEEAVGVARVKADAGFIENEESPCESCAETASEVDSL